MKANRDTAIQVTYFLLRVIPGLVFAQVGSNKLFGLFGGFMGHPRATVPLMSQLGIAGALEVFGGLLIVFGLLTRPVAFILSGEMAVAYWQAHAKMGPWPFQNKGMPAVLFCFLFLYFAARGAGPWSLDALVWSRRPPVEPTAKAGV